MGGKGRGGGRFIGVMLRSLIAMFTLRSTMECTQPCDPLSRSLLTIPSLSE